MVTFDELEKADVSDLPIKKRVEAFYKGTEAVSKFAESVMIPVLRGQLNLTDREQALVGTYYRMYAWIRSMVVMNGPIHFQGAAAASRSLFELLLDLKILATDKSSDSVDKFHAFPEVEKYRVAKNLVSFAAAHPRTTIHAIKKQSNFVNAPGRKQSIDASITKHWGTTGKRKPKHPKHWTGRSVRERARKLAQRYEELYLEVYPLYSWYSHSGSTGYAGLDEKALEACFGLSHRVAQKTFLEATLICAQKMRISSAIEGLRDILDDLRLTPGKVIVEEQLKVLEEDKQK